jgi:hypothetical protein
MPDLSLLLGAAVFTAGMLTGRFWPARRKGLKPRAPVEPVCGCTHHHSFHDPETGECHGMMKVPASMSRDSYHMACTCRQYSGATPLPAYYAPEIGG